LWAKARKTLMETSAVNVASLEDIESAIAYVSFDDEKPLTNSSEALKHMLMGPPSNRWFDKAFGIFVCANGVAGFQFEHSSADAWPFLQMGEMMLQWAPKADVEKAVAETPTKPPYTPEIIRFEVPASIHPAMKDACDEFQGTFYMLKVNGLEFKEFGKKAVTSLNCSPDAFVQMSMQLAYFRLFGKTGSTYAAGGTKMFSHGRTETIKSSSLESIKFCEAVEGKKLRSKSYLNNLFRDACYRYTVRSLLAKTGKGCDRLLFGLKQQVSELGYEIPALYRDKSYETYLKIQLSTSNVPTVTNGSFQVFGPVNETCFGVCYAIYDNRMTFGITSFDDNVKTFVELFRKSLSDNMELLKAGPTAAYQLKEKAVVVSYVVKPYAPIIAAVAATATVVAAVAWIRRRS